MENFPEITTDNFTMKQTAAVRIVEPMGIRFTATINADLYQQLVENFGDMLEIGTLIAPEQYVKDAGDFTVEKLEALPKQNWYSLLQQGVIRYAMAAYGDGSVDGARKAWEQSLAACENPWALRNLAMLYKNEYHIPKKAHEMLLNAFRLKPDCRALALETAMQLTADGSADKWLELYDGLSPELRACGRLRLLRAVALLHLGRLEEAAEILNRAFVTVSYTHLTLPTSQQV